MVKQMKKKGFLSFLKLIQNKKKSLYFHNYLITPLCVWSQPTVYGSGYVTSMSRHFFPKTMRGCARACIVQSIVSVGLWLSKESLWLSLPTSHKAISLIYFHRLLMLIHSFFGLWFPFFDCKKNNDSCRFCTQPPGDSTCTVTTSCLFLNLKG